jgi:hypothetical protein
MIPKIEIFFIAQNKYQACNNGAFNKTPFGKFDL